MEMTNEMLASSCFTHPDYRGGACRSCPACLEEMERIAMEDEAEWLTSRHNVHAKDEMRDGYYCHVVYENGVEVEVFILMTAAEIADIEKETAKLGDPFDDDDLPF